MCRQSAIRRYTKRLPFSERISIFKEGLQLAINGKKVTSDIYKSYQSHVLKTLSNDDILCCSFAPHFLKVTKITKKNVYLQVMGSKTDLHVVSNVWGMIPMTCTTPSKEEIIRVKNRWIDGKRESLRIYRVPFKQWDRRAINVSIY